VANANNMPFAGKWTWTTSNGLAITLKESGELVLEAVGSGNYNQQINAYGDPAAKLWLQGANWNYIVHSESGYTSTAQRTGNPAQFALEGVSGDKFRIVQKTDGAEFYLSANGSKLERIPKAGGPPDSTIFIQQVVSPGLAQLKFGAMGRNLRGVYFSGDDLTDFVFSGSDLSYAIFKESVLKLATLQGCTVEKTDFTGVDLDEVTLIGIQGEAPVFQSATLHESTDLSGAKIPKAIFVNAVTTGTTAGTGPTMNTMRADEANFNGANLTAAVLNGGIFLNSQWINAKLINAQVGSSHFDGATMDRITCTGAALQGSYFDRAQLISAEFQKADITSCSFKAANLTNAKLSEVAGLTGIQLQGAQLVGTILTKLDLTSAGLDKDTVMLAAEMEGVDLTEKTLNDINFVRANLKKAKLDRTSMERAVLVGATLSFASVTGNVSFVGADLSNSSMEGAKLNGAQMGARQSIGNLPAHAKDALDQRRAPDELHSVLGAKGLKAGAVKVTVREPGRLWIVEDACGEFHLEMLDEGVRVDQVGATPAAVLSNVFMPNADLTGANLYAVDVSGSQWYGSNAKADNANLELVNLSNANLSTMNFTQARMYGANLSFARVVGTNFTGAKLTPTTQLRSTSFSFASMQGAIFTAAQIGGANLTNAAVSLKLAAPVEFVGVPLFPLDPSFAATLGKKIVSQELRDAFAHKGYPVIDDATIRVDSTGVQWTIWNDESSETKLQAGYSKFILWKRTDNGIEEIAVFGGSPVLVIRTNSDNEQEQAKIAFAEAKDIETAMDDENTTPSGMKLSMRKKGVAYEVLMTGGLPPRPPKCIPSPDTWCS
jgi:uncharacterized protein YjbI with pentapeptide repeats